MKEVSIDIRDTMHTIGSGVKLVFDAFDRMRDVRHNFELSLIHQLRETVGTYGLLAEWIRGNLDFINTVVEGQHAQERELSHRLQQLIVGVGDIFLIPSAPPEARTHRPATPHGSGVRVTVRQNQGRVAVPIALHNHQGTPEFITLEATPFREVGSARILTNRIHFEPPQVELAGGNSAQVRAVIDVSPEFQPGRDYVAEIRTNGSNGSAPQSIPVQCTVLPADAADRSELPASPLKKTRHSEGKEVPSPFPALQTLARRSAIPHDPEVRATVYQNQGLVGVPITLHNHQGTPEFITLEATPFYEVGSGLVLTNLIRFEPPQIELAGGNSAQVRAVIDVSPEFQPGRDYMAEIRVGGSEPQSLRLRFTVLAPSIEELVPLNEKPI